MSGRKIMKKKKQNLAFEGVEIYDGWEQDGRTFGCNMQKQITGAAYGIAGAAIGAKYGALAAGAIGACFFGIGAVPAAIVGGFIGAIVGGFIGEESGEYIYDQLNKTSDR